MRRTTIAILSVLILGAAGGLIVGRYWPASTVPAQTRYVCPMHPAVVKDEPGTCPICGMALVSIGHEVAPSAAGDGATPIVSISPVVMNNLGVRIVAATRATLRREAILSAYVQNYAPGGTLTIHAGVSGRIVALRAEKPGQRLMSGELVAEVVPAGDAQAAAIRIPMPQDGVIVEVHAKAGDNALPETALVTIQTVGQAFVEADVFQNQALWIKASDPAELRLRHWPGRVWRGRVEHEGMRANFQNRTYTVRLVFPMTDGMVMNDMYGEVRLFGEPHRNVLTVPHEALIRDEHGARVVLALGEGRFKPMVVKSGIESGGRVEILSGLKEGDSVVVSAQFLLDSESSLRAEFQRMSADPAPPAVQPVMGVAESSHQHDEKPAPR
jgi:Cu(I)/Ag(I) efflux system membrane fusion protein